MVAQTLVAHRWEHRILLVVAEEADDGQSQAQLTYSQADPWGYRERKMLVYQVLPDCYRTISYDDGVTVSEWKTGEDLYRAYAADSGLRVLLIGLDGGVKRRQAKPLTNAVLFALIDGMPIRRAELRREGASPRGGVPRLRPH